MTLFRHYKNVKQNGRVLIVLLFSCFYPGQNITVDNENDYPVIVKYSQKKAEIGAGQKKEIKENGLKSISVLNKKDEKLIKDIPVFLNLRESLAISIDNNTIKFKGDKDLLHHYVYQEVGSYLRLKIGEYQKYDQKNDPQGFIRTSEMYLGDVLTKVEKLNNSPQARQDIHYKEIEKLVKEDWLFTVFSSFGSVKLGNTEKSLMLYYFEKYFKKDIDNYSCSSWVDYDIIRRYALHQKVLGLSLPKYEIVEHSDDDDVNQYLPSKCQEQYFRNSYKFLIGKKDPVRAEKYKKILTEKFHVKL
ncbi:hypothetical protein [Chryseobacterium sp. JUb7]|uniref:hypothetical protein n=1 Tax=Chryseobacterium sp. JUb7 TaxID=2940599 RepID=UPI0021675770|nr:hypothetical protein [Chryseobacterium sp. JUb7]MCS3530344.1 hypothetical protein [Chryseobacterium sp. JUb7]